MSKNYTKYTDEQLIEEIERLGLEDQVTETMERKDIIDLLNDQKKNKAVSNKNSNIKTSGKDYVIVKYLNKGTLRIFGTKWKGHMSKSVTKDEAKILTTVFSTKFKIVA